MKRMLAALLCLLGIIVPAAPAEGFSLFPAPQEEADESAAPEDTPSLFPEAPQATPEPEAKGDAFSEAPDNGAKDQSGEAPSFPADQAGGALWLEIGGQETQLDLDTDPEYSFSDGEYVQACFYAYGTGGEFCEVYLIFPESVVSGTVVSTESCTTSGDEDPAVLYMSYDATGMPVTFAAASQIGTSAYPDGSQYAIRFDTVVREGGMCTFSGTFDATLTELDEDFYPVSTFMAGGAFAFSLELASPAPDDAPGLPGLVTPPDARKI